jgi:hypothetical protein
VLSRELDNGRLGDRAFEVQVQFGFGQSAQEALVLVVRHSNLRYVVAASSARGRRTAFSKR